MIYRASDYYNRFGFKNTKPFGITNTEGKYPLALQALELYPYSLRGITRKYQEGEAFDIDEKEAEAFDQKFPAKEKRETESQKEFIKIATKFL